VTRALALLGLSLSLAGGHRIGSAGVTVALPPHWHAVSVGTSPVGNHLSDPVTRLVVASAPIGFGRGCNELDYRFAASGVAIVVVEWTGRTPGTRWRTRPQRFTATTLPIAQPPALECWHGPGGGTQFADHGRRFAVFVLVGPRAAKALVRRARAVLDTLRVRP
jgi:hypothetical protein